jgi:NADPH:quinone reductase-like Zn-dependent oxidoreductase
MKAVIINDFGSPELLRVAEVPVPDTGDDEVLVSVKAISINPIDCKTRSGKGLAGKLKEFMPLILGWDISGVVEKTGKNVKTFKEGDAVFGMVNFPGYGKAYAEYVAVPEAQLAPKPENITYTEAAASTLAALTAWQGMTRHAKINKGQQVLVYGASGGVGHFAVQIAKYFGAVVTGASSLRNMDFVKSLGADYAFDYHTQALEESGEKFDFVWDPVGGDNIDRSLKIMKTGSTIVSITSGMNEAVTAKAGEKGITGIRMLVQSDGGDMKQLAGLLEQDILKPHVSKTFDFNRMPDAHKQIETGHTVGKVVVLI